MTGSIDPLGMDGVMFCVRLLPEPYRAAWESACLIDERDDEIVFAAKEGNELAMIQSAGMLRDWMKEVHCSTPKRYRIKIKTVSGETTCI